MANGNELKKELTKVKYFFHVFMVIELEQSMVFSQIIICFQRWQRKIFLIHFIRWPNFPLFMSKNCQQWNYLSYYWFAFFEFSRSNQYLMSYMLYRISPILFHLTISFICLIFRLKRCSMFCQNTNFWINSKMVKVE